MQTQLDAARLIGCTRNPSEVDVVYVLIEDEPRRMVENVQRFHAHFERLAVPDRNRL